MAKFVYDKESGCYEAFDDNYRYIASIKQLSDCISFEIVTLDNGQFDVYVSDVRSTIEIIETTVASKFWGGATVKTNGNTLYTLHYNEGKIIKTTFYKNVYQWVHGYHK